MIEVFWRGLTSYEFLNGGDGYNATLFIMSLFMFLGVGILLRVVVDGIIRLIKGVK